MIEQDVLLRGRPNRPQHWSCPSVYRYLCATRAPNWKTKKRGNTIGL